jgi:hypothetical protein
VDRLGAVLQDLADRLRARPRAAPPAGLFDANFIDVETGEEFWLSGPKRDRTDGRYSNARPLVESDAAARYDAFLAGAPATKLAD